MPPSTVLRLTRALRHRNFRLFFAGQSIPLVGTWITRVATSWLIYRLTGSELVLGLAGFCGQIPTLLITPLAGVLVDRMDRRRMLVLTQAASLLQSAALAGLTLAGHVTVVRIVVLQVLQGIINACDTPARQAFVSEMVDHRRDLANANTFLQTIVEERLRGRVMSFYTMAFFGTVPIGSLIGGGIAERLGAPLTIASSGLVCLAAGAWFAWRLPALRALVRPVYREMGILTVPAVDAGAKTLSQPASSRSLDSRVYLGDQAGQELSERPLVHGDEQPGPDETPEQHHQPGDPEILLDRQSGHDRVSGPFEVSPSVGAEEQGDPDEPHGPAQPQRVLRPSPIAERVSDAVGRRGPEHKMVEPDVDGRPPISGPHEKLVRPHRLHHVVRPRVGTAGQETSLDPLTERSQKGPRR
jgi:hypothetical protein